MSPDEAVEAAAKAMREARLGGIAPFAWEQLDDEYKKQWRKQARAALEAATPHLMAAAWDEGRNAVWTFMSNTDPRRERPTNPYRKESQ